MSSLEKVIYLSDVTIAFPNLVEPQVSKSPETGKEKVSWNCEFLLTPDNPQFQQFLQLYGTMAVEKWKNHAQTIMNMIQAERKQRCYGMGTEKVNKRTLKPLDGYEGMVYLTAGNKIQPQMIDADGRPVDAGNTLAYQQLARRIYGGCKVNAAVKPWLQENEWGRGVRLDLCAIQFARDGKPFGEGHVDASGMFAAVAAPAGAPVAAAPMPAMPFPGAGMPSFGATTPAAAPPLPPFMQPR